MSLDLWILFIVLFGWEAPLVFYLVYRVSKENQKTKKEKRR